jgi:NADH:ubiquinone oxidoreductase subunit 6 (subunit J)
VLLVATFASPGEGVMGDLFARALVVMPVAVLIGAVAIIVALVVTLLLPGRREVKLALLAVGCAGWIVGFVLLLRPGLIDLP